MRWRRSRSCCREGAELITGAVRVAEPVNPAAPAAFNSIYVIDHSGSIVALYDKVHLVPFGEYLPFRSLLERLGMAGAHQTDAADSWLATVAGSSPFRARRRCCR